MLNFGIVFNSNNFLKMVIKMLKIYLAVLAVILVFAVIIMDPAKKIK